MATEVLVPPLGTTVDTVTLVKWYREEGETVKKDDPLFAIETDKSTMDIEAPADGVLRRVTAQEGDEVQALVCIALIAAPDEDVAVATVAVAGAEPPPQIVPSPAAPVPENKASVQSAEGRRVRKFISPRAKRLADQHNVPAFDLQGTGPDGAIIERDIRVYLDHARVEPEPSVEVVPSPAPPVVPKAGIGVPEEGNEVLQVIPLRSVRAVTAERMAASSQATARVTLTRQVDATSLVALRRQLNEDGIEVSYNDLLLHVLGHVLGEFPQMNSSLTEEVIQVWQRIHIGLAVDTDRGLLVPVVRDVDRKGLRQLAKDSQRAIEDALEGRTSPDELKGGTFTLTNLGMYGVDAFTPIINLPECAVLGVGRIAKVPAVVGDSIVARHMVWLSLSFDHRLVDGAPAARFLQRLVQLVERPHLLLVA